MSYHSVPDAAYRNIPAGAPNWQRSPVPGWGMNVARAGGPRVGMGCLNGNCAGMGRLESTLPHFTRLAGAPEEAANKLVAYASLAAGAGLVTGLLLMYMAFESGYLKASRR
jgi:hypothetical protein